MFPPEHIERMHDPSYHEEQRLIRQCEESVYCTIHNYLRRKEFPQTITGEQMNEIRSQVRSQVTVMYSDLMGKQLENTVERLLRQGLQRTHAIRTCQYEMTSDGTVRRL